LKEGEISQEVYRQLKLWWVLGAFRREGATRLTLSVKRESRKYNINQSRDNLQPTCMIVFLNSLDMSKELFKLI
jgi:hypothetical protein